MGSLCSSPGWRRRIGLQMRCALCLQRTLVRIHQAVGNPLGRHSPPPGICLPLCRGIVAMGVVSLGPSMSALFA